MGKFLKNIWDNVVGEGGYKFIKTWGFPLMTPILLTVWGWIRDIPGPYLVQMFLATFAIALFIVREWRGKIVQAQPPPHERVSTTDIWPTEIAERDLHNEKGVVTCSRTAKLRSLDTPSPYLEIEWTIFNGLVWKIEIEEHPTGHLILNSRNSLLPGAYPLEPRYSDLQFPHATKRTMNHGASLILKWRHWCAPSDIAVFKQKQYLRDGFLAFDFRSFNIWTVRGPEENKCRIRLDLQRERFYMSELMEREKDET